MTRPIRIQLSRRKGFELQTVSRAENGLPAVNVARPSKWGNPFYIINEEGFPWLTDRRFKDMPVCNPDAEQLLGIEAGSLHWDNAARGVVALFRQQCCDRPLAELRGKNLACWCQPDEPCHADVLLELANG